VDAASGDVGLGAHRDLQVQTGGAGLDAGSCDGVHIALAQDQEVVALHLDLVTIFGAEQHLVALLGATDVWPRANDLTPHQPLLLLGGSGNENPAATTALGLVGRHAHEDPIVQHLDRPLLRLIGVGDRFRLICHDGKVPSGPMDAEVGSPTSFTIASGDGVTLEAEYHVPAGASALVVLSHPHPQYGGDMYNPLIEQLFSALPASGIAAVRYNFRGVGRSTGEHGEGVTERLDAEAAFAAGAGVAESAGVDGPVVSAGWSFGADVSLAVGSEHLAAWVGIAAPLAIVEPGEMAASRDERPTLLLVPEHDQFRSPESAADIAASWPNTSVVTVAGGDHFLMGRSQVVAEEVEGFLGRL
jgi:uncharacterized protein